MLVSNPETVVRLLYTTRHVNEYGAVSDEAFPSSEVQKEKGRTCSVVRKDILPDPENMLYNKACADENPKKNNTKWGYFQSIAIKIRTILRESGDYAFDVTQDIVPDEIDPICGFAHAHIHTTVRISKSEYRKLRFTLKSLFSNNITKF